MRYGAWIKAPELGPPQEVAESDAIDLALENGQWKGLWVYIFASGPTDVARWVDDEEEDFTGRERGLLWIHRGP